MTAPDLPPTVTEAEARMRAIDDFMLEEIMADDTDDLSDCLSDAVALIGHAMPMDTTALVAGKTLTAREVWERGKALLFPREDRTASTAALRAENEALRALLGDTRALVVACCPSGFTDEQAVMALYQNNGRISAALGAAHE